MRTIDRFESKATVATGAAEWLVSRAAYAIERRGRFFLCLAGGSTPRALYERLASDHFIHRIDWSRVVLFLGDERVGEPAIRNATMVEAVFRVGAIAQSEWHPIPVERGAREASGQYHTRLVERFGEIQPGDADWATFDVVLLGIGEDGHTASLFPKSDATLKSNQYATPIEMPVGNPACPRVTLTFPALNAAHEALFLVTGSTKGDALRAIFSSEQPALGDRLPAARIAAKQGVTWFLDSDAAQSANV